MERERAMVRKEMIEFLRLLSNCSVLQPLSFMMNSNPGFKSQFVRVELPGPPPDALAWKGGLDRHARKTKSQVLLAALLRKIFRRQLATRLQFVRSTCVRSVTKLTQHFAKETGFFKHFPFISDQLFNQYLVRLQPLATLTFTGRNRGSGKRTWAAGTASETLRIGTTFWQPWHFGDRANEKLIWAGGTWIPGEGESILLHPQYLLASSHILFISAVVLSWRRVVYGDFCPTNQGVTQYFVRTWSTVTPELSSCPYAKALEGFTRIYFPIPSLSQWQNPLTHSSPPPQSVRNLRVWHIYISLSDPYVRTYSTISELQKRTTRAAAELLESLIHVKGVCTVCIQEGACVYTMYGNTPFLAPSFVCRGRPLQSPPLPVTMGETKPEEAWRSRRLLYYAKFLALRDRWYIFEVPNMIYHHKSPG